MLIFSVLEKIPNSTINAKKFASIIQVEVTEQTQIPPELFEIILKTKYLLVNTVKIIKVSKKFILT